MQTFYGHVNTLERFFSYDGPGGTLRFSPWNNAYGAVHPDPVPGTGENDVELILNDGEFFQVLYSTYSRASGPGKFLDYRAAYREAVGNGEDGTIANIRIVAEDGCEDVTALAADGTAVVMGHNVKWRSTSLQSRIRFLNRPAVMPEKSVDETELPKT